ncbi:hypothetical protein YC2023_110555 [Brassica napus]
MSAYRRDAHPSVFKRPIQEEEKHHISGRDCKKNLFHRSPCSGDCRVLRAVVRSSEPPCSRVSPFLLVYLCGLGGGSGAPGVDLEGFGVVGCARGRRRLIISSSSLRIGGVWVVGGPLQVFSHLSVWRLTDGGFGVLLGFGLRALCSGHQTLALFSAGGLQWVAWELCKVGLRALLTVVLVAAHCGSLRLPLHSSELPAVWRSSPLSVLHLLCAGSLAHLRL